MNDKQLEHSHDFDGIEELDNDLPRWWLGIFWVTSLVAVFYVPYYHFINPEKLPHAALEAEVAAITAQREAAKAEAATVVDESGQSLSGEEALMARFKRGGWEEDGKSVYDTYCMPCHLPDGGGSIGPNFTDDYYIHGGTLTDIQRTITEGVPEKGMVSWKLALKPEQIDNVAFYIRTLRGKTPAIAKEAQGKLVDDAGNFLEEGSSESEAEADQPEASSNEN